MEIDILRLLREEKGLLEVDEKFDFHNEDFKDFTLCREAELRCKAEYFAGAVELDYSITVCLEAECSRCLKPVKKEICVEDSCSIERQDFNEEFPELPLSKEGRLDLREFTYQELVLKVFPIFTCSEDCRGLCGNCGKLKADCSCKTEEEGDPRLQILKQLLTTDDE